MPLIRLATEINAPIERCFDLARSIDFHMKTARKTQETAVGGLTSGLIGIDQIVTWQAKHFGIRQQLTVKIIEFEPPYYFRDVMIKGAFKTLDHSHRFERRQNKTFMIDEFCFSSPIGILGNMADKLFLESYMRRFLVERNQLLKEAAESEAWKQYLV